MIEVYIKYLEIKVDPASFMGEGEPDIEELLIAYESQKNVIQQLQVNTGQLQVNTGQLQVNTSQPENESSRGRN